MSAAQSNTLNSWWQRMMGDRDRNRPADSHTHAFAPGPAIAVDPNVHRLERLQQRAREGELAAVELELFEWHRKDDCPQQAKLLLASLLSRRGLADQAYDVLDHEALDAPTLQMRIALLTAMSRIKEAKAVATTLYHEHGRDAGVINWLAAMNAPGHQLLPSVPHSATEQLAGELFENTQIIRSLVVAQKIRAEIKNVTMLRDALRCLWKAQCDRRTRLVICEGIAELSVLLGDFDEAMHWAHQGLRIEPYYAPLALVLSQISDDQRIGPLATDVLAKTHEAHPRYRDIRAALIRRQFADGQINQARQRLAAWSQEEGDHHIVRQLREELAA